MNSDLRIMKLLVYLPFILTFFTSYIFADESLRGLSVVSEYDFNEGLSTQPSSLSFLQEKLQRESTNLLMRDKSKKQLTSPPSVCLTGACCLITPDSNGHVDIPDGTTDIVDEAFYGCAQLTSINIPASVKNIGDWAFSGTGLVSVDLIGVQHIGNYAFNGPGYYWNFVSLLTSVILHEGLESIGDFAFSVTRLSSVTFPKSLRTLGASTFYNNPTLAQANLAIDGALNSIPYSTFGFCGLSFINIPKEITEIGPMAFQSNIALASVTFTEGLEKIDVYAFLSTSLTHVALPSSLSVLLTEAFTSVTGNAVELTCLNPTSTYSTTTLCQASQTPCLENAIRLPNGGCECLRGYRYVPIECVPCPVGYSTIQGGAQCIAAETVPTIAEKKCRGYRSIRNVLPGNSVSIKYMSNTEEKMLVFSNVPPAFFYAVSTVEVRFMISHHKAPVGGNSFVNVLTKKQDYYDQRYLLAVPLYTNQTSFDMSFPSCIDHLLEPGQYISKLRLIFYGVPPESMLTFDTIVGCNDYHLDQSSSFDVNEGVCMHNPQNFALPAM